MDWLGYLELLNQVIDYPKQGPNVLWADYSEYDTQHCRSNKRYADHVQHMSPGHLHSQSVEGYDQILNASAICENCLEEKKKAVVSSNENALDFASLNAKRHAMMSLFVSHHSWRSFQEVPLQ